MSNIVKISKEDIIYHLKISCQIPSLLEAIATRTIITETAQKENITITKRKNRYEFIQSNRLKRRQREFRERRMGRYDGD
jgi:hypothetical protein